MQMMMGMAMATVMPVKLVHLEKLYNFFETKNTGNTMRLKNESGLIRDEEIISSNRHFD